MNGSSVSSQKFVKAMLWRVRHMQNRCSIIFLHTIISKSQECCFPSISIYLDIMAPIHYPILSYVWTEIIVNCVLVFVVLLTVGLRVAGRLLGPGLWWDDYLVMIATPLGVAMMVCSGFFAPVGNGYDLETHPELVVNITYILKLVFAMQVMYCTLLALVKASMLLFFIRIFGVSTFMRRAVKILLGVLMLWWISFLCACVFLCNPVSAQWTAVGKCGEYMPMIMSLIATNAVGDAVIMVLPMRNIWSLQMRTTDKMGISACFILGLACIVCAVFRLIYISTVNLDENITGTMPTTVFLFIFEPNLAILCVSIPMLRPFYSMYKKRTGGSRLQEYYGEQDGGYQNTEQSGLRSKTTKSNNSQLEMDPYLRRDGTKHDAQVTSYGDDSGSEQHLNPIPAVPKDVIGVETKWTVVRN